MQVIGNTIEDLKNEAHNPELFQQIVDICAEELGEEGEIFTSANQLSMVSWYIQDYNRGCNDETWPLIAITPQKNSVSIYIFVFVGGQYLVEVYTSKFGKSNTGKSCIRFRNMTPKKEHALREVLTIAKQSIESKVK